MIPKWYEHDCAVCRYVGAYCEKPGGRIHDLYVCEGRSIPGSVTCVARYGNEGGEYASMSLSPDQWDKSVHLHEAKIVDVYCCRMPELLAAWKCASNWHIRNPVPNLEKTKSEYPEGHPMREVERILELSYPDRMSDTETEARADAFVAAQRAKQEP